MTITEVQQHKILDSYRLGTDLAAARRRLTNRTTCHNFLEVRNHNLQRLRSKLGLRGAQTSGDIGGAARLQL